MDLNDRDNIFPYIRNTMDDVDPPNIVLLLNNRQLGMKKRSVTQLQQFAELKATVSEMKETHCQLPQSARSTFLMSFSHDCSKVASTHGDHNIYVSDVKTGKNLQKLEGHPRTPWCIAFHPTSNDILASGCLAGEVRVWDLHGGSEKWRAEHDQVIASLTFHPFLQLLVIATGSCLYFWDWSQPKPAAFCSTNSELERVRYVKFDNYGHRLITGISNMSGSGSGLHNSFCDHSCHHVNPHHSHTSHSHTIDLDDSPRTSRRSIMERLRNMPDFDNPFRWQSTTSRSVPINRPDRTLSTNRTDSSRPIRPDRPSGSDGADRPSGSGRSQSNRINSESRPYRDDRSSSASPVPLRDYGLLITESFTEELRRVWQRWEAEEFGSSFSSFLSNNSSERSSTESHTMNSELDSERYLDYLPLFSEARWHNAAHPERNPRPLPDTSSVDSFTLFSGNNPGTSAEHQNSSLSDHDYFSESSTSQSRVNDDDQSNNAEPSNGRHRETDPDFFTSGEFWHTFVRLRSICSDLERRLIRQVYLQRNDAIEPRAGPSLNDGGSSTELSIVPRNDSRELEFSNPYTPIINMLSRIRVALRFSTISLTAVRDRIDQIRRRIREIITRIRYWTGGRHVGRIHQDIFEEMTVQLTEQMDRLLQADERLANTMALSQQTSAAVQASQQSSIASAQNLELSLLASHVRDELPSSSNSYQHTEWSSDDRNTTRRLTQEATQSTSERSSMLVERVRFAADAPVTRLRMPRYRFNPLSIGRAIRRNLANYRASSYRVEVPRRRSHQGRLTPVETIEIPSSPVTINVPDSPEPMEVPSAPVTTEVPSPPLTTEVPSASVTMEVPSPPMINEASIPLARNYSPEPRTLDLLEDMSSDDDILRLDGLEDSPPPLAAEIPSVSATSNYSRDIEIIDLEDISDTDDDIFTSVHSNEHLSHDRLEAFSVPSTTAASVPSTTAASVPSTTAPSVSSTTAASAPVTLDSLAAQAASDFSEQLRMYNMEDMSDEETDVSSLASAIRNHHSAYRRRNAGEVSSPDGSELELFNVSGSRLEPSRLSSFIDPSQFEPISDASSDDSDRPITPPLLMYSPTYTSLLFNGNSRIALNDPLTQNHRIQVWDFSPYELPAIYDATANVVVRRCMIHNDASVDISQDGEKLVALIPPEDRDPINNLMFGVFSLKPGHLGKTLCIWGYISNAISVSFSPLAQYVVVGSAYSRPIYSNPEKAAVAQIIKINKSNDAYDASYIRSFTQVINNENRFQQVSLNCVRWLPQSGLGIAYATNRGCLCICKPTAGEIFENPNDPGPAVERNDHGARFRIFRAFMRP